MLSYKNDFNCTIIDEELYNKYELANINYLSLNIDNLKQQLKIKNEKIKELKNECCICLEKTSTFLFINCGHYCICNLCNDKYINNMCPKCRKISNRIKVY